MFPLGGRIKEEVRCFLEWRQHNGRVFHFINSIPGESDDSALAGHYFRQ